MSGSFFFRHDRREVLREYLQETGTSIEELEANPHLIDEWLESRPSKIKKPKARIPGRRKR